MVYQHPTLYNSRKNQLHRRTRDRQKGPYMDNPCVAVTSLPQNGIGEIKGRETVTEYS